MRNKLILLLSIVTLGLLLAGCGDGKTVQKDSPEDNSKVSQPPSTEPSDLTQETESIDTEGIDEIDAQLDMGELDSFDSDLEGLKI